MRFFGGDAVVESQTTALFMSFFILPHDTTPPQFNYIDAKEKRQILPALEMEGFPTKDENSPRSAENADDITSSVAEDAELFSM